MLYGSPVDYFPIIIFLKEIYVKHLTRIILNTGPLKRILKLLEKTHYDCRGLVVAQPHLGESGVQHRLFRVLPIESVVGVVAVTVETYIIGQYDSAGLDSHDQVDTVVVKASMTIARNQGFVFELQTSCGNGSM